MNRGDSIKHRRRRQCADSSPMKSSRPTHTPSISCGVAGQRESNCQPVKVVVLGVDEVGKTALLQQFMTSAYMAADVQTHFGKMLHISWMKKDHRHTGNSFL